MMMLRETKSTAAVAPSRVPGDATCGLLHAILAFAFAFIIIPATIVTVITIMLHAIHTIVTMIIIIRMNENV